MALKLLKNIAEYSWASVFCVFNALGPITFSVTTAIVFPLLHFVAPRFLTKLMCYFADIQWRYFANGVEHWGRAKFHFYGNKAVPDRENCIVVMNHISILDWLYILNIAGRRGRMGCVKFFAKVRCWDQKRQFSRTRKAFFWV
jgi:1-acyl-sn-glycerol-3-phosphate acyltransferase